MNFIYRFTVGLASRVVRWPTVCTRCGSLHHLAKDCDLPQQFGVSDCERELIAERRRDRNSLIAVVVVLFLAHVVISAVLGVSP